MPVDLYDENYAIKAVYFKAKPQYGKTKREFAQSAHVKERTVICKANRPYSCLQKS